MGGGGSKNAHNCVTSFIVIYDPKTGLNSPVFWTVFRDLDPKFGLNILNLNTT